MKDCIILTTGFVLVVFLGVIFLSFVARAEDGLCSIVNDWWCYPETATGGEVVTNYAKVYAPASLSPLDIEQPWHDHWWASRDTLRLTEAALTSTAQELDLALSMLAVCMSPPPLPPVISECRKLNRNELWKPVSETTKKPVFLTPGSFTTGRGKIVGEVKDLAGNKITNLLFRTCCPNGGREHYDIPVAASQLGEASTLHFNDNRQCIVIPNPTQRQP